MNKCLCVGLARMILWQEIANVISYAPSSTDYASYRFVKGLAQNGSLPREEDDKGGHYIFELGGKISFSTAISFSPFHDP